ncbi:unnamed protein product [Miscanthus lutarioriparius]|uniref:Uncharacterized protein n=1 Tax=Miscanthus lutarioriparius TaxID=422564 RepID=A0A811PU37_9POAL|nr:unnamed protein product [Miscanthus lutarioriparius]
MDSTLPRLLPPLPSVRHQHRPHHPNTVPRRRDGPGGGSSRMLPAARVKTDRRRRDAGRFRAQGLFGDGGGGDGLRTVMRMVKLNSAIQNRSVRELLELLGDECLYFFGNLRSVDVPQLGKNGRGKKLPWDLDCNVSTSHVYRGLLLISQVNKICVPLLQRILGTIQQASIMRAWQTDNRF